MESAITKILFSLILFTLPFLYYHIKKKINRKILIIYLFVFLPGIKICKKIDKAILRYKISKVSNIQLEDQDGYIDVEKFASLRHKLKGVKLGKGIGEHLRLAEQSLTHLPLNNSFYSIIEHPPTWMLKNIHLQLDHFKKNSKVDVDIMIEEFKKELNWKKNYLLAKYKVKSGRVYVKDFSLNHYTLQFISAALVRLAKSCSLPDMEFVISFHDSLDLSNIPAPIFAYCKKEGNPFIVVIPEHEILAGYKTIDSKIDKAVKTSMWETKKDIAFWRGSTTSGDFHLSNWREFPRTKLVMMAKNNEFIDAKFSLYVQGADTNKEFLLEKDLKGNFVFPEDSLGYKYLIDIDGNASGYSRFYWILRSNCVPLKQMSQYQMWFYPALEPFTHFIPYHENLSDLSKMLDWARSNPEKAKRIAEEGRRFIIEELTQEHAYAYLYLLLMEYSKL